MDQGKIIRALILGLPIGLIVTGVIAMTFCTDAADPERGRMRYVDKANITEDSLRGYVNDFAVKVTGLLDIHAAGTYHIGFNSDDGVSLRIQGRSWDSIAEDVTGNAAIVGDELKNDSVTGWSFTAGQITLPAGCHSFEAVMFERGGGAFFELLGRGVSDQGVADPSWHLLRVGGAKAAAPTGGLQLVPLN